MFTTPETEYETAADVFTHSGPCPQCGEDAPCYEDRTGELYCMDCLTEAVTAEVEKVNAQEFDNLYLLQAQQAKERTLPALAPCADFPF